MQLENNNSQEKHGKEIKIRKEIASGIISMVLGIIIFILIPANIKGGISAGTSAIGAEVFPQIIAGGLVVLGIAIIVQSLIKKDKSYIVINLKEELRALIFIATFLAYILLLPVVGYEIMTPLFACGCLVQMNDRNWKHYVAVLVLVLCVYLFFSYVLNVNLP